MVFIGKNIFVPKLLVYKTSLDGFERSTFRLTAERVNPLRHGDESTWTSLPHKISMLRQSSCVFLTNYSTFLSTGKDLRKYRSNFTDSYFSLNGKFTVTAARKSYVVFFLAGMIEEFISDFSWQISYNRTKETFGFSTCRLAGLVVRFSLWVREVTGSIPVQAQLLG